MKKFALAGNPNCGKTTMFNSLTGSTAHVGNWPGVTVDKREGVYKKCPEPIAIVDLPGIYSLSPYTSEEVIARDFIMDEKPDCIINIVDATNFERNLYLTTQLMEIDSPVVVALNMIDALDKNGEKIDEVTLSKRLGLPVVKVSALKETGLEELMNVAYEASKKERKSTTVLKDGPLGHLIGDVTIALKGQNIDNPLFHAIKLVETDEIEVRSHEKAFEMVEEFKKVFKDELFGNDLEAIIADGRYKYITTNYSPTLNKRRQNEAEMTSSDKVDRVLTHRIWGIPIFLVILFAIFHITFSTNFLFLGGLFSEDWVSCAGTAFEGVFGEGGISSPGVTLQSLVVVGADVAMSLVESGLVAIGSPDWVVGFLVNGVLEGLFSVLSFVPQILVLFLLFSILEDSGYMARIAFILDKFLRKFGLSGRAFMPMIMGFGCSVPAMINTRTLADEKEKVATIRVIPFFSCGAKLPILIGIAGAMAVSFGIGNADLVTYGMYLLGIVVALVCVLLMRNTTLKGDLPPFIMELPTYRMPQFKSLMRLLWDKLKHFIKKAFTIILASTIVIWFVSHFSFDWQFLSDEQMDMSILASIGKFIQPLFTPLGFGSQCGQWGWMFVVACFMGLLAKENVISAFSSLAACIVVANPEIMAMDAIPKLIAVTGASPAALIAFIAFNMLTIPCMATVATARGEMPDKKTFNFTILFWLVVSYSVSMMVYVIGTAWWTVFIFAAVIVVAFFIIKAFFKDKDKKAEVKA